MRHHERAIESSDPLALWASELRAELVVELGPNQAMNLAGATVVAGGATATTAAVTCAAQGGMTMTTTSATLGASTGASLATKVAAASLAATLAVGASAAVTGSLPTGMQSFAAGAASNVGIEVPRPGTIGVDAGAEIRVGAGGIVEAGPAGSVSATVDASTGLVVTGIQEAAGFTASVVSRTSESAVVRFDSAEQSTTVLLTTLDGELLAGVTTETRDQGEVSGQAQTGADAAASTGADGGVGAEPETTAGAETEAEAEAAVEIEIGIGG